MLKASTPGIHRYLFLPTLLLMAAFVACSGNPGDSNPNIDAAGQAGTVVFNLSWGDAPSSAENGYDGQRVTGDVCVDYNIAWIQALALDASGVERSSGRWECIRKSGTLTGLAQGRYDVIVTGEVAGVPVWRGEAADIQVLPQQMTDAGLIAMVHQHDATAPVVVNTLPADGATGVAVNAALTARFDNAIVGHSIDADNFILTYTDPVGGQVMQVPCAVSYDGQSHTAVLQPIDPLLNDTAYRAAIIVDRGSVVEDMAGNLMQQEAVWTFTSYRPDRDAPQVIARSPENAEMDVILTPVVQVRFSEAVNPTTITANSIYLAHNGAPISSVLSYDDQLHRVTLSPVSGLPSGATITATVTTDLHDLAGNPMAADTTWSFVTQYPSWRNENLDGGLILASTQMALEPNDTINIIASQGSDGVVTYLVSQADNTWTRHTRSGSAGSELNFGLTINNQDIRMTTYLDVARDLIHLDMEGPRPAGGWMAQIVNPGIPVANVEGLQIASIPDGGWDGGAIIYYDTGNAQLKYAADSLDWNHEVVAAAPVQHPVLVMSSTGVAHIAYYDPAAGQLKHAERALDGTWTFETVDGNPEDVGAAPAMVLDAADQPHISYLDATNASLKYATRQPSGQWLVETVDDTGNIGHATGIALDSLGLAHISYHDDTADTLKYAARTTIGSWHTATVDAQDNNGFGSAIVVDSRDYVHISYCYSMTMVAYSQLRYATTRPAD